MRKRCNNEAALDEPPEKKPLTSLSATVDVKPGKILSDILGKKWKLGKTVGTGGFGMIYLISDNIHQDVNSDAQFVAKIETHKSGPLFVERNCYLLIAKPEMISEWKENNKLEHLGMPHYVASGSHNTGGNKYRFLIIPRFDKDLDEMFEAKKRKFNLKTVLTIALQTIDVLQYMHSRGYVHSDIKASNILLGSNKTKSRPPISSPVPKIKAVRYHGCTPIRSCKVRKISRSLRPNLNLHYLRDEETIEQTQEEIINISSNTDIDKIYLLDYGLASKYVSTQGQHKQFCSDERKAHAGTILFCSRDAHEGAQSRRSDLECLGYNLIYWLTSNLPWSQDTENPERVHQKKIKCIHNLKAFLDYTFNDQCPRFLFDYFSYLQKLEFEAEPDYNYCKNLFKNAMKEYGYKNNLRLDFDNLEGWGRKQKKVKRSNNSENFKRKQTVLKFKRSPLKSNLPIKFMHTLRAKNNKKIINKMRWSKILDPEIIMKRANARERKLTESSDSNPAPSTAMNVLELNQLNPTMAMKEVFNKSRDKHFNGGGASPRYRGDTALGNIEGYTPAMMEVYTRKKDREELELEQLILTSKSRSRSNSRTQKKSTKKQSIVRNKTQKQQRQAPVNSPPRTRQGKSQSNLVVAKKEAPRQPKSIPLRRTYSLRG